MPRSADIFTIAETIDESPEALAESPFLNQLTQTVGSINGQFTDRAVERGIDRSRAEDWLDQTQGLVDRASSGLGTDEAADLAVRLYAASFILSAATVDASPEDLLVDATLPA